MVYYEGAFYTHLLFMSLFGGGAKSSYLGVDFGSGGIKLVELMNEKGRARLLTYAFVERGPSETTLNYLDDVKETSETLKKMLKKARAVSKRTVSGLPISSVFGSIINIQKTADQKEMNEAVRWQAKKLIPMPLEEMALTWQKIDPVTPKPDDKYQEVLLTAASKTMIKKYTDIFALAGLELMSLETEAFALIRSLIGRDRSANVIVDVGGARTNIIIVENGIPYVSRSVAVGGHAITKEMSNVLNLPEDQAEGMKLDAGSVSTLYEAGGFPKLFEKVLAPIVTELNYSSNLFLSQKANEGKRLEKIILTGGGALLPNIADYLAKASNMRVYIGDPWARVVYPDALKPVLAQIGPRFGVPIGLAMRDID